MINIFLYFQDFQITIVAVVVVEQQCSSNISFSFFVFSFLFSFHKQSQQPQDAVASGQVTTSSLMLLCHLNPFNPFVTECNLSAGVMSMANN